MQRLTDESSIGSLVPGTSSCLHDGMGSPGSIRVGTSGWNYRSWRGRFYPNDMPVSGWFAHYSAVFNDVEINNTFYQLPEAKTFDLWKRQAPRGFFYAIKANRFITHLKKLKDPEKSVDKFLRRTRRLGPHLGPILYQLPPNWQPDLERLESFCECLPEDLTHVVEFRQRDWLQEKTYEILRRHKVGLCVHDLLKRHPRPCPSRTVYIRFHGAGQKYGGSYSRRRLQRWADWMQAAAEDGHEVYAYFNNGQNAFAVLGSFLSRIQDSR